MSSTGGGIVVHPNETKPVSANGKELHIHNCSAADFTLSDPNLNALTSILPNHTKIEIPAT